MILAVRLVSNFTVTSLVCEPESVSLPPYCFFMTKHHGVNGYLKKEQWQIKAQQPCEPWKWKSWSMQDREKGWSTACHCCHLCPLYTIYTTVLSCYQHAPLEMAAKCKAPGNDNTQYWAPLFLKFCLEKLKYWELDQILILRKVIACLMASYNLLTTYITIIVCKLRWLLKFIITASLITWFNVVRSQ